MTGQELIHLFEQAHCRTHIVGTKENGVVAALDSEGRLFTIIQNKVVSKVNPSALFTRSNKYAFQNPGGDALWPAPEGTTLGYEYGTGSWRVPPSITGAVWEIISQSDNECSIRAEIDLINNSQLGIPCEFERQIRIETGENRLSQKIKEIIRYIGKKTLNKTEFSLAPWSLCQFASSDTGKVYMPIPPSDEDIWDMYGQSDDRRNIEKGLYAISAKTPERFQLALSKNIAWIQYVNEEENYSAKRYAETLPLDRQYIDIADTSPENPPSEKGVSLSVYCDPSGFLEIEACGGCPETLEPCTELFVNVTTEFEIIGKA